MLVCVRMNSIVTLHTHQVTHRTTTGPQLSMPSEATHGSHRSILSCPPEEADPVFVSELGIIIMYYVVRTGQ